MWHVILRGKELFKSKERQKARRFRDDNYPDAILVFYNEESSKTCTKPKWRKTRDGFFTYYYNVETGEKKLNLEDGDEEVV